MINVKNKTIIATIGVVTTMLLFNACNSGGSDSQESGATQNTAQTDPPSYDPNRGEGKYDESNVPAEPLNVAMAEKGKVISGTKCLSCHKMTNERLVGPGWAGVTERRTLHWLMNFITDPDPMIDKDPELQAQLELCLVRMPNQNLTDEEAREIVEYMRQNDGVN